MRALVEWTLAAALLVLALAGQPAPAAAQAPEPLPPGFIGVMADGPFMEAGVRLDQEFDLMGQAGAESVRAVFGWTYAQPYASWGRVPQRERARFTRTRGAPTDFSTTDRIVAAAAARGMRVLPVVFGSPRWAAKYPRDEASPPRRPGLFARYAAVLARRYGHDGSFWRERPELPYVPIRDWQIWNEPNLRGYWRDQPFAYRYTKLLRATRARLRRADRRGRIVLGGLVYDSWRALDRLYRVGAGRYFDVAAVHPFTRHAEDVPRILEYARLQMRFNGDRRKPLLVTELTWPSAAGKAHPPSPFDVSEEQQAENLRVAFRALTADRVRLGIAGVYWYTWASPDRGDWSFSYAGLRRDVAGGSVPKPAYDAFVETVRELRAR